MLNIMTLEDFFTLTEVKDGLTVPARVEELVAVMKNEKDCALRNVGDAMKQRSTAVSILAVTDSKECLDRFVQLEGLVFIDGWLKDAREFSADANDCLLEESVVALLQVLEKLEIENDKLKSSGIYVTVRDRLSHKSVNIQDKAKVLGNPEPASASGATKLDSEVAQAVCEDRMELRNRFAVESDAPISSSSVRPDQKSDVDQHVPPLVGDNAAASSGCGVDKQSVGADAVEKESGKLGSNCSESDSKELKDIVESSVIGEKCSLEQKPTSASLDREQGSDARREVPRLGSVPEAVDADIHNESLPNKLFKLDVCSASFMPKHVQALSSVDESCVLETDVKAGRGADIHVDSSTVKSISADPPMDGTSTQSDDRGVLMNCTTTLAEKSPSQDDEICSNTSHDSSVDVIMLTQSKDLDDKNPQTDNLNSLDEYVDRIKHVPTHIKDSFGFDPSRGRKSVVTSKTSAMDLEYGIVDALEVACLVAKEVEQQVVEDFEEDFGSFSKKRASALHIAGGPASINGKKDQHADVNSVDKSPVDDPSEDDELSTNSDNLDAEPKDGMVTEPPQVCDMAPEAVNSAQKGTSKIDLNLEICLEAADDAGNNVSNLVSVVSATRAVAAGLPASTLKFEGSLGWKGSAATSAFRPASPRRTSDVDKTALVEEATDASRQGHNFVFDLNLAEDCVATSSGKSMVEPSLMKSEHLSFDLNLLSEDRDAPFTPSLKPVERNFDLNDGLLDFSDPPSDLQPYLGPSSSYQHNAYGGAPDDSMVSIMGAKVKKNSFIHNPPATFLNMGRASEPLADANLVRSGPLMAATSAVQYPPPPLYSYNGIAGGPTLPFPPSLYGPGGSASAYMVDSRGMSIMPHLMGAPPSTFQPPFGQQPSYTSNMLGSFQGPNVASSSRSQLDFNMGFVTEGANRVDTGSFRQFFPGQGRTADLQLQLQPLFPGIVGGKRKEPDGGWERHPPPYM